MRFSARLLAISLLLIIVLFIPRLSFAQNNNVQEPFQVQKTLPTNVSPNVPQNLHTWTQTVMIEVVASMTCQILGVDPIDPNQKCLTVGENNGQIGFSKNNKGAVSLVGNMIASLYTPPIHTGDYIAYLNSNFGFTKSANAQAAASIGFIGLTPVMDLWKAFRNISYFIFILIFIIVGITVMLRIRIDPRTVMTIQNQIPKLIIGILLITFSYAIAAFLIDIMWLLVYLAISTINPGNLAGVSRHMTESTVGFANYVFADSGGSGQGIGLLKIMDDGGRMIGGFINTLFTSKSVNPTTGGSECSDLLCDLGNFFSNPIQNIIGVILGAILGFIGGVIAFFIIGVAMLVQLLKLWFKLLIAYVMIIVDVILAPIWIVAGLLPGVNQSFGFGSWIRDIMGNLMVFPAVIALFLLGNVIFYNFGKATSQTFNPPLVGNASGNGFGALIALGIILMAPNVVDMVKKAFKSQGAPGVGGISAGSAAVGAVAGAIGSKMYYKDPRTGETRGPLANAQRNVTSTLSNSRVSRRVANIPPIRVVRQSRFANLFRSQGGNATGPTTEQTTRAQREQADRE